MFHCQIICYCHIIYFFINLLAHLSANYAKPQVLGEAFVGQIPCGDYWNDLQGDSDIIVQTYTPKCNKSKCNKSWLKCGKIPNNKKKYLAFKTNLTN